MSRVSRSFPGRRGFVRRGLVAVAAGLLLAAGLAAAAEIRTWSDSSGQFNIEARFVSLKAGKVTLAKEDGTQIEVELTKLGAADQAYAKEQAKAAAANPFKPVPADPFRPAGKTKSTGGAAKGSNKTAPAGNDDRVVVPSWTEATAVLVAPTGSEWSLTVGPPVGAGASLAQRPIPLPPKSHFFEKAVGLVVNPVSRRAVVGYHRSFPANEGTSTRLVLCDLENGKMLGSATQAGVVLAPLAIHDDGTRVLMRRDEDGVGGNHDRLEVWKLGPSGIERGLRWIPHDDAKGDKRDILWAEFVDAEKVATMSKSGRLTVWELASARPLYYLDVQSGSTPALSPDRKFVAFSTGKDVGVLDVAAAKVVAMQSMAQVNTPILMFSPSGKRLACAAHDRLYVWDFAKGTLHREVPYYGVAPGGQGVFASDDAVLLGKMTTVLIDLENQVKLWTYQGAELIRSLGGLCWFVPNTNQQQAGALVPSPIPQPGVKEALAKALTDPNFFVLKPGTTVKVNVDGLPDAGEREKARAELEKRLKAHGFKVGPEGTIELVAATEVGKAREVSYRSIGRGFPAVKSYKVREHIARVKFVYQGLTAWEASTLNIPFFARLKQGETMEEHLKAQEKPNYAYFGRVELPKLLTRPTSNGVTALGNSQVTTSGVR
jgi:hypothetical protein